MHFEIVAHLMVTPQVVYVGSLIGMTVWSGDYTSRTNHTKSDSSPGKTMNDGPDKMVAYFSMVHVGIWIVVGIFDR